MIEPGNMRERPRGLEWQVINQRLFSATLDLLIEVMDLEKSAFKLRGVRYLEEGAANEIFDRLAIARQELDIIKRLINSSLSDEVHDRN